MSVKTKAEKINWEELGTNASFLPVAYLVVMAPGFLALLGICCLIAAGVGSFSFGPVFPVDFFLIMAGILVFCGLVLVISYRVIIKRQFKLKKGQAPKPLPVVLSSPLDQFLAPFLRQIKDEQQLFLDQTSVGNINRKQVSSPSTSSTLPE